jgi:uncharacterized protein YyaL (SSP411 family)
VTEPAHANRLADETSPYLLQHAHNPVDWYPWGPEALERARHLDRPIFLSIGYAACHWCHVMERESFEDPATAADLAQGFVAIKVDREERPDLDALYMDAVQAMTGQGGWPMSVFLTPDGRPFYGGTYFPGEPRHGLPSFRQVLAGVSEAWRERRADVEESATRLAEAIAAGQRSPGTREGERDAGGSAVAKARQHAIPDAPPIDTVLAAAVSALEAGFDPSHGGWGGAPRFPQPMTIELLLREHLRTADARPLAMARRSLDVMAAGGIHDQLGGGFARYATDDEWLVPHFEKMLYDNAQLARAYLHAWQVTHDDAYADVARDTLDFALRELRIEADGAFAASLDADTQGSEGATYVWTPTEVAAIVGDDAALFMTAYGVTPGGNWEGRTILSRVAADEELALRFGLGAGDVARSLAEARERLLAVRAARAQPARDGKVLAAWNGLMLGALAEAGRQLPDGHRYRAAAIATAGWLWDRLRDSHGRLRRSWTTGRLGPPATLEDHADLADGLLELYESTFDERWFVAARELMDTVLQRFADPDGGFFDTAHDAERLIARPRRLQDSPLPSGNAMAATVLLRLAALTGEARHREAAERALVPMVPVVTRYPAAFAQWLIALGASLVPTDEVAIVGQPGSPDTVALLDVVRAGYRPWQVVAASGDPATSTVPLLRDRIAIGGEATAYVCRAFACRMPVTTPAGLQGELGRPTAAA